MSLKLYHFTSAEFIDSITAQGVIASALAVPNGPKTVPVVSLTTLAHPGKMIGKSLTDGKPLSGENLKILRHLNPYAPPDSPTVNTVGARLTLCVPDGDANLRRLSDAAEDLGFDAQQLIKFIRLGGGSLSAWWIYEGNLPAAYIVEIGLGYPRYDRA